MPDRNPTVTVNFAISSLKIGDLIKDQTVDFVSR
jgi:hypothetical protein